MLCSGARPQLPGLLIAIKAKQPDALFCFALPEGSAATGDGQGAWRPEPMTNQPIRSVMTVAPYSIHLDHALSVAAKLMRDKNIRHLPVLKERSVVGILAERDLDVALFRAGSKSATVSTARLAEPVVIGPEVTIASAARSMAAQRADIAVVVDKEHIIGVFTTIDALKVLADALDPPAKAA